MPTHSRREYLHRSTAGALGLAVGLSGCMSAPSDEESTETRGERPTATVEVGPNQDFVFKPGTEQALRIAKGTKVTFTWKSDGHNIVVGNQPDDANWQGTPGGSSDLYDTGYTYEHTFDVPGDYHYWCQPHKSLGMKADIAVQG